MTISKKELGTWGEEKAKEFLIKNEYTIIIENYRIATGEIDIIVSRKNYIVFVEVKTRCSTKYGPPQSAVISKKKDRIRKIARHFLNIFVDGYYDNYIKRFDVIAITVKQKKAKLVHIKNAF